jgi:hypothetical protein
VIKGIRLRNRKAGANKYLKFKTKGPALLSFSVIMHRRHKHDNINRDIYIYVEVESETKLNQVSLLIKNPTNIVKVILNPIAYIKISISGSLIFSLNSRSNMIPGINVR